MGIRKSYRNLTTDERARFVRALHAVKADGVVDDFARIHTQHFSMGIHNSSHFLPWHREFVHRFEAALQKHDRGVWVPYWDSSAGSSPGDSLWDPQFLGQFDQEWNLHRTLGADVLPTPDQVAADQQHDKYEDFWPDLEQNIHNPPHRWVGGVMAGAGSPGDPVFFLHHAWIDRLWAQWQIAHPNAPFVASGDGVGLHDPMMEWPDRTPADVLDHHVLGYSYDFDFWHHGVPSEGAVPVAPGTSPTSWYTTPENVQHIAYVGTDQKIHELFFFIS